ncbi:phage major capsid protein [Streptomyces sp. NPDC048696]|uniref:phage major capsid protein n=1 Tax=Streptomyces sp. NPDC048696 TaxID=3365585 RepID=UPI003720FC20
MNRQQMITQLKERRADEKAELDRILNTAQRAKRGLTPAEHAAFDRSEARLKDYTERIDELTEQALRDAEAGQTARKYLSAPLTRSSGMPGTPRAASGWSVTGEPEVYTRAGASFFRDLWQARQHQDRDALDRLDHNNKLSLDRRRTASGESRALSTVNSAGGEFVPPLWLEEEWVALARPGRVTADLCASDVLPPGTDVINLPKVSGGTATAQQATQNTAIQQTDMTTTSVSSPVITIAGGQTVSLQLIEQSPINVDGVILADLAADYAAKLDQEVLSGTGAAGHVTGLLVMSGAQAVTWTQATPALAGSGGLYGKLASTLQAIHTARYAPPDAIVMHPRRWAWCSAQSDTQNRPMIVPGPAGPINAMGVNADLPAAQGPVGTLLGLPVFTDPNIPTNLGAGTNEDRIILTRRSDLYLWESHLRAEALPQTYAQNLSMFVRLYNYAAFIPHRYPQATGIISGTGLVTPTF